MKFKYRRYFLYYLARAAIFFVYFIPRAAGLSIASKIGEIAYYILPKYRRLAVENLRSAFSDIPKAEINRIARGVFSNLVMNGFELIQFPKLNKAAVEKLVIVENRHLLDAALSKGKGVVLVTAHFGNWELMAALLRILGYKGSTIGRRLYFDKYDKLLNKYRLMHDVHVVYRDESPRKMLKVLKDNAIMGIVADQDVVSVEGVYINFFGREAYTPIGPVALAKVSGAALVPAFIMREGDHHRFVIEKEIELADSGDKAKDMVENTQRWSNVLEKYIRKYPSQWVWMHKRWKTSQKVKGS